MTDIQLQSIAPHLTELKNVEYMRAMPIIITIDNEHFITDAQVTYPNFFLSSALSIVNSSLPALDCHLPSL
jgi:hypothetical protein